MDTTTTVTTKARGDRTMDPVVADRLAALQRVLRAQRELERQTRVTAAGPAGGVRPDDEGGTGTTDADLERVDEIHRRLVQQRRTAHRPFRRHTGRIVLALELAERLALDRLGFADYAELEAHLPAVVAETTPRARIERPTPGSEDAVIDLDRVAQLERELAEAERALARLIDQTGDVAPLQRRVRPVGADRVGGQRPSRRHRALEAAGGLVPGATTGPPSLFDRPDLPDDRPRPATI